MLSDAKAEGIDLRIVTAYRSYSRQQQLYEAGATTAAAGTSEHNSGLAVDILTASGEFEGSSGEAWLLEHAAEYGFILRYPKDKESVTGFAYEPWHFRYVGKEQAKLISESGAVSKYRQRRTLLAFAKEGSFILSAAFGIILSTVLKAVLKRRI